MEAINNAITEHKHPITANDLDSLPAIVDTPDPMILEFMKMNAIYVRFVEMFGYTPDQAIDLTLNQISCDISVDYIKSKIGSVEINDTEEYYKFLDYLNIYDFPMSYDEEEKVAELFPSLEFHHEGIKH